MKSDTTVRVAPAECCRMPKLSRRSITNVWKRLSDKNTTPIRGISWLDIMTGGCPRTAELERREDPGLEAFQRNALAIILEDCFKANGTTKGF